MSMRAVLERGLLPTLDEATTVLEWEGIRWHEPAARDCLVQLWAQQRGLENLNADQREQALQHAGRLIAGHARLNGLPFRP